MKDEDCEDRAQEQLASLKRDMRKTMEDATVRAMHKVMAEFEAKSDERLMENAQGELKRINLVQTGVGIGKPAQEPITGGDERRHIICLCPDCTKPAQPQQSPVKVGRITDNIKGMVLRQEIMLYTEDYLPIGTALYTSPPAQRPHECSRSHPHENMDAMCELRTEIARLTNENARLKARQHDPVGYLYQGISHHTQGKKQFSEKQVINLEGRWWQLVGPVYTSPPASKPLSDYINRAGINANDSPITVVEKLERAIKATNQETQRTWQGLTDEEFLDIARTFGAQPWPPGSCVAFGQMVEAKLKEKNA